MQGKARRESGCHFASAVLLNSRHLAPHRTLPLSCLSRSFPNLLEELGVLRLLAPLFGSHFDGKYLGTTLTVPVFVGRGSEVPPAGFPPDAWKAILE